LLCIFNSSLSIKDATVQIDLEITKQRQLIFFGKYTNIHHNFYVIMLVRVSKKTIKPTTTW
jgi:hypothetical protein